MTLFINCVRNFDLSINNGSGEWGLLALYEHEEILKKSSSLKRIFKNCAQNFDRSINMAIVNGGYGHKEILKKIFSSETAGQTLKEFHRNIPWVTRFKNYSRNFDSSISMVLVNWGYLHYRNSMAMVLSKIQVSDLS